MSRRRLILLATTAFVAFVAIVVVVATSSTSPPATSTASRQPDVLYRPVGLSTANKVPLVIGFHASGGTPSSFQTTSNWNQQAAKYGFVVWYPGDLNSTTGGSWNPANMPANLAYVSQKLSQLEVSQNIDPARVYATGFSAGATMTYFAGCQLSSKIDGIAPISGAMRFTDPCTLTHPESELEVIGTNDAIPINGSPKLLSAAQVAAKWQTLNGGCTAQPTVTVGVAREQSWSPCKNGAQVGQVTIISGTHQYPGSPQATGADAKWAATPYIWSFFSAGGVSPPSSSFAANTIAPTGVTSSDANLQMQGICDAGTNCYAGFRYRQVGTAAWTQVPSTLGLANACPASGSACHYNLSQGVLGLQSGGAYEYQALADENNGPVAYFGPDGTSTTTQQFSAVSGTVPSNTTLPSISGTAQQGSTLTLTSGAWSNATSIADQWQLCSTSCVSISGATGSTYVILSTDVGSTIRVEETATNATGSTIANSLATAVITASGGGGNTSHCPSCFFFADGHSYTPNAGAWGAQCANYGTPSLNGHYRGSAYFGVSQDGQPSIDLSNPTTPAGWTWAVCNMDRGGGSLILPEDDYYGFSMWIGASGSPGLTDTSGYANIGEVHFQDVGGSPDVELNLHNNGSITLGILGGCYNGKFQYSAGAGNVPNPLYAVPVSGLKPGWNDIAMHVHWASDNSGLVETYFKPAGSTTWSPEAHFGNYPSITWNATSGNCSVPSFVKTYADNWPMNYGTAVSSPDALYYSDVGISHTSLADVENAQP